MSYESRTSLRAIDTVRPGGGRHDSRVVSQGAVVDPLGCAPVRGARDPLWRPMALQRSAGSCRSKLQARPATSSLPGPRRSRTFGRSESPTAKQPSLRPSMPCVWTIVGATYQAAWTTMARFGVAVGRVETDQAHRAAVRAEIVVAGEIRTLGGGFRTRIVREPAEPAGVGRIRATAVGDQQAFHPAADHVDEVQSGRARGLPEVGHRHHIMMRDARTGPIESDAGGKGDRQIGRGPEGRSTGGEGTLERVKALAQRRRERRWTPAASGVGEERWFLTCLFRSAPRQCHSAGLRRVQASG